jgi:hypothetical protein
VRRVSTILAVFLLFASAIGCSARTARTDTSGTAGPARSGTETGNVFYSAPWFPDPPSPKGYLSFSGAQAKVPFAIRELRDPSGAAFKDFVVVNGYGGPGVQMRSGEFIAAQYNAGTTQKAANDVRVFPQMPFDPRYMERVQVGGAEAVAWDAIDTGDANNRLVVPFSGVVFQIGPDWFTFQSLDGKISRAQLVQMAQELATR